MVTQVFQRAGAIENELRRNYAIKLHDLRAFKASIAQARRQLEIDRALLETSQRIVEESRDLKRQSAETLARARRLAPLPKRLLPVAPFVPR